jgi:four helix bundle protein
MFEVLQVALEMVKELAGLIEQIALRDPDLARQIRKAGSSAPMNIAEGNQRAGKDRKHFFRIAAGSAKEVHTALAVAQAWSYVGAEADRARGLADRVAAMLWPLGR